MLEPSRPKSTDDVVVATALWHALTLSLLAKVARAADLWSRSDSIEALLVAPLTLGPDLVVAALLGGLVLLVGRLVTPRVASLFAALLLLPWALLVGMSVMSYRLTGTGLTFQRLRGDEGATLADLELLARGDLILSLLVVGIALALLPALYLACRWWRPLRRGAHPLVPASVALVGLIVIGVEQMVSTQTYGLEENPLVVLVESLRDRDERVDDVDDGLDRGGWAALHRPSAPIAGKLEAAYEDVPIQNVVVVLAEGVPWRYTSFGPAGVDATPNLRRRVESEGLLFERFYAHYHSSIQSIFSLVCSAYPPLYVREGPVVAQTPRIDCGELSEHLSRGGRKVGLFHGGRFAYYDKLSLLGGRGYDITLDAESLRDRYPKRKMHKWGIDDRAVVQGTLDWIDTLPEGQPFGALLIPITAHYPYWIPPDVERLFPGEERQDKFSSAVAFLDQAFEDLLKGLEERELYENTLVIYVADHGEKVQPLSHKYMANRAQYQQNLHVPLALLNPRLFPNDGRPRRSDRPGGMIDVLPTVLDVLDLPADERHFGQSLLSPRYEPRRVYFGAFHSGSMFSGFVEGDKKYALHIRDKASELYDLAADPDEQTDLSHDKPLEVARFADDALAFYRANQVYFLTAPSLPEEDVHSRLLKDAEVALLSDDGRRTLCSRDGLAFSCPGLDGDVTVRLQSRRVDKRTSECVDVRLPGTNQQIELLLRGDALALVSGTRVGLPDSERKRGEGEVRFSVEVDDDRAEVARVQGRAKLRWLQLRTPRERLRVTVERSSDDGPSVACLIFSDVAWRSVKKPVALDDDVLEGRH